MAEANREHAGSPPPAELQVELVDGTTLPPGDYHVELDTPGWCRAKTLERGLTDIGFTRLRLDVPPQSSGLAGTLRFYGRLAAPLTIRQQPLLRWAYARRLSFDPLADLSGGVHYHDLETGVAYEVRFLNRAVVRREDRERLSDRKDPLRDLTIERLLEYGWEPLRLAAVQRDMRVPGRPGASCILWVGLLRWRAGKSVTTDDEPFQFEDVATTVPCTGKPA